MGSKPPSMHLVFFKQTLKALVLITSSFAGSPLLTSSPCREAIALFVSCLHHFYRIPYIANNPNLNALLAGIRRNQWYYTFQSHPF